MNHQSVSLPEIGVVKLVELSVSEVRQWLKKSAENPSLDLVDCLMFDDFQVSDLPLFTDLKADAIEAMTPNQLRTVIDEIKRVNPHFFEMRGRLVDIGTMFRDRLLNASGT